MENYKREFIEFMISCGVLRFGEFITKSGRKSPYFVNTGNYKTGAQMANLGGYYAKCLMDSVGEDFDVLFGPAYKGIPLATTTAVALSNIYNIDKPFCFNRKEVKDHGEGGSFIGHKLSDGERVVLIEDVITAGTAVREVYPQLRATADVKVEHMIISVDRMEHGQVGTTAIKEIKHDFGITVHPIVTVREIIEHMHNRKLNGEIVLNDEIREKMEEYLKKYCEA
ncbi:MAG: orotate phosphoribosyltransferase [Clostridiales bacterium]|nr:orotate phosphoribosyltransferase [Clostridiales bacterium]